MEGCITQECLSQREGHVKLQVIRGAVGLDRGETLGLQGLGHSALSLKLLYNHLFCLLMTCTLKVEIVIF